VDPLSLTCREAMALAAGLGVREQDAARAYREFHQGRTAASWMRPGLAAIGTVHRDEQTVKFTLSLPDGLETESVVIPMPRRTGLTRTLCVSSQVGCAMGCTFCETAQMGLMRQLSPAEIVGQWFAARHRLPNEIDGGAGFPVKNIVFMGMGEPTDNLPAVLQAIRVLTDHRGPAVPAANITVSTVGRSEGIRELAAFAGQPGFRKLNLAFSLNAPNDEIRSRIMPINRAEPIERVLEAMRAWPLRTCAAFCMEYVLIPGVNDAPEHCDEVCRRLRGIRCSLNVIPYNPRRDSPWRAPTEPETRAFVERAIANGQFCKRRGTKGRTAMAACGQLGNERIRRRRFVDLRVGG
jgi:23S rRNA (adenine2503-C2)-methyltransferase